MSETQLLLSEAAEIADGVYPGRAKREHVMVCVAEIRKLREWQHYAELHLDRYDRAEIERMMNPVQVGRIGARAVEELVHVGQ
jgi:hypothetical protein